jgi:transcriptional regulator with XRE-family HTH domain
MSPTTLHDARIARGIGQVELARQVGVGQSHISMLERGRRVPSITVFLRLCRALDLDPAVALDWKTAG